MRRLITTTAIAALLAAPVTAQTESGTQSGDAQAQPPSGQMEIEASNLIGQRLYIQRDASAGTEAAVEGEAQPTEQAAGAQPVEGEETTEQAAGAQPAEGETTEQTAEGQTTGQAADPAETTPPAGADMAGLEGGVADAPDTWTMAGEIDDVLLTQEGEVQALVVDTGGFLGMNEATRRIDIAEVRFVPDTDDEGEFFAVYTGDQQMLQSAEAFDEASVGEGMVRGREMWGEDIAGSQTDVAFTSITTDELVGTAVYGSDDNWVGEIGELALTEEGEVEAVIVDVGGFLGIGEKPVALTMEQIQLRRGEGGAFGDGLRAYVNATEEELESMEAWEDDAG